MADAESWYKEQLLERLCYVVALRDRGIQTNATDIDDIRAILSRDSDPAKDASEELQGVLAVGIALDRASKGQSTSSTKVLIDEIGASLRVRIYREETRHKEPHVHITRGNEDMGTYSLLDGRNLQGEEPPRVIRRHFGPWLAHWRSDLLRIWHTTQDGGNPHDLVRRLRDST